MNSGDFGLWLWWKVMKWPLMIIIPFVLICGILVELGEAYGPLPPIAILGIAGYLAFRYIRRRLPQRKRAV